MPPRRPLVVFAFVGAVARSSRALRQIRALAEIGAAVQVLAFDSPERFAALELGDAVSLSSLERPAGSGPPFFWKAHRLFRRAALAIPAAAYHASDLYTLPAMAAAARRHGGRLVYDSREWYVGLDDTAGRPHVALFWGATERTAIGQADAVFTVNGAIADRLAHRYRIGRPHVVRNVSEHPAQEPTGLLRERLGLPPDRPLALYQGLFRAGRGLDLLIGAMAQVPEADLVLIGEGPEEDALRRLISEADARVHFVPFTDPDHLLRLTADADLGVIPILPRTESLRLALPNKVFEYAAAGLPILAGSGIEPLAALVREHEAGPVVDPSDPEALVGALREGLLNPEAQARYRAGAQALHAAASWRREKASFVGPYAALLGLPMST
jgi:glycosyltransferase involved in cell wall biosynthesis